MSIRIRFVANALGLCSLLSVAFANAHAATVAEYDKATTKQQGEFVAVMLKKLQHYYNNNSNTEYKSVCMGKLYQEKIGSNTPKLFILIMDEIDLARRKGPNKYKVEDIIFGVIEYNCTDPLREGTYAYKAKAYTKAREWFNKACNKNTAGGCFNLGLMYDQGNGGAKDLAKAREFYIKACTLGDGKGCFNSAHMLMKGTGGPQDKQRAMKFLAKACSAGREEACAALR